MSVSGRSQTLATFSAILLIACGANAPAPENSATASVATASTNHSGIVVAPSSTSSCVKLIPAQIDAEVVLDVLNAGALAPAAQLEAIMWIVPNATNRAEKLRAGAIDLKGAIAPSVEADINAEADAIDAVTHHRTQREWDLDRAALSSAIDRVRAGCGDRQWPGPRVQLAQDAIAVIARYNASKMRVCYEAALEKIPGLEGRVVASFVIESTGTVSNVEDAGSDLPAKDAVKCTLDVFRTMHFPVPRRGSLKVIYPIIFNPGD